MVALVANASDPYFKNKPLTWIEDDRRAFESRGFDWIDIDLRDHNPITLLCVLKRCDILHVCGGSAIYLLRLIRKQQLDRVILNQISGGLIYTGTSAGSMIMAPSIKFCCDDEDEKEAGIKPKSAAELIGFGLVPFYMICHNQDPYYIKSTCRAFKRSAENKLPILALNDGQAVWVDDSKLEIVP